MNNNLIFLGLLFILLNNGTINSTQTLLLLALLTTQNNGCDCNGLSVARNTTTCSTTLN